MADEVEIRQLLERYEQAFRGKDARAAIACYADDVVAYNLAPPLEQGPSVARDQESIEKWFATWVGPINLTDRLLTLRVGRDVAFAFTLRRMTGAKTDGQHVSLWFRSTVGLEKRGGGWKIAHVHVSVPFAMDGSGKALLELEP
jgi:ketosteroid isomerase-like protein